MYVRVTDLHVVCAAAAWAQPRSPGCIVCGVDTPPHPPGAGPVVMSRSGDARSLPLLTRAKLPAPPAPVSPHTPRSYRSHIGSRRTGKERSAGFPSQSLATADISGTISAIAPAMITRSMAWTREYVARVQEITAPLSECRGEYYSERGVGWLQHCTLCTGEVLIVKGSDHTGWPVRQTSTEILSWGQGVPDRTRTAAT